MDKPPAAGEPPVADTAQGTEQASSADRTGTHPYPEVPQLRRPDAAPPAEQGSPPGQTAFSHLHWEYQGTNSDVYTDGTRSAYLYSPAGKPDLGRLGSEGAEPAKGDPAALPDDVGRYLSTGDRQVGIPVVGEKPDKSPGDTSDLPPTGDALLKPDETDVPRYKRFGREVFREVEEARDLGQNLAETAHNVLSQPSPTGYVGVTPRDATVTNIPTAAPDPGSIASLVVVSGVLGFRAAEAAHHKAAKVVDGAGRLFHKVGETLRRSHDDAGH
jgi:hypothetical protein